MLTGGLDNFYRGPFFISVSSTSFPFVWPSILCSYRDKGKFFLCARYLHFVKIFKFYGQHDHNHPLSLSSSGNNRYTLTANFRNSGETMRENNGERHRDRERRIHRQEDINEATRGGQTYEAERQRASAKEYRHPDEQDDYQILDRHNRPRDERSSGRERYGSGRERGQRGMGSEGGEPLSSAHRGFGENDRNRRDYPERDTGQSWGGWGNIGDRPESRWGGPESEPGRWTGSQHGMGSDEGRAPFGRESSAFGTERAGGFRRESGDESTSRWGRSRERQRGKFSGVGPMGYERSDERLHDEICDRLTEDGDIDASEIKVEVKNREVQLSGTVNDRTTKYNVEELVDDISGVKDIDNRIKVRKPGKDREYSTEQNGASNRKKEKRSESEVRPQRI